MPEIREYIEIEEYDCEKHPNAKKIKEKLKTELTPVQCPDNCICLKGFKELGHFSYKQSTWKS